MTQNRIKSKHYTTQQKHQVLQLLSDGKTQKEIAVELGIPHRSIEFILNKLRKKMDCTNNEKMIKKAMQQGLINW